MIRLLAVLSLIVLPCAAEYTFEIHCVAPCSSYTNPANVTTYYDVYVSSCAARVYTAVYCTGPSPHNTLHYHIGVDDYTTLFGGDAIAIPLGTSRSSPAITRGLVMFITYGQTEEWFITSGNQSGLVAFPNNYPGSLTFGTYWPDGEYSYRVFAFAHDGTGSGDWWFSQVSEGWASGEGSLPNVIEFEGWIQ